MSAPADLFAAPAPRVFTMPPGTAFLPALAEGLVAALDARDRPEAASDALVLAPTRRAARELARAFLQASGAGAALLPAIRALGDVEEDAPPFAPGDVAIALPPELAPARRRFELAALLHRKATLADPAADPAAAVAAGEFLGRILDEAAEAGGVDLAKLRPAFDALPRHRQEAALFLDIIAEAWPARLRELGRMDASARRDALMGALAERWRTKPPDRPVIAAGSTGSIPATAELLAVVARLPKGCVVLPGLDRDLDEAAWTAIDDQHPQAALARLLRVLGVARPDVPDWPWARETAPARARRRLVNEALRPADATADWLARLADMGAADAVRAGLDGLAVIEAANEEEEARAIALALRQTLETPDRTAMLVTPDRGLAKRVEVLLGRWDAAADVSAGEPLSETPAGAFLGLVLDYAQDPGDGIGWCALLKHPLTALGRPPEALAGLVSGVERAVLRGVRPGHGLEAIPGKLARAGEGDLARAELGREEGLGLARAVRDALRPLAAVDTATLAELAANHVRAAEALAAAPDASGAERIWAGPAGEAAALLMRELLEEGEALPPLALASYRRIWGELARARAVRVPRARGAAIRILGPLEARLLSADLVILGGLNEGSWPAAPPRDPFLSRGMRALCGLPAPERRLGLAAHDFAQLAASPRLLLTRAKKSEGAPTVASRWLWRLAALAHGADVLLPTTHGETDLVALARTLDRVRAQDVRPVAPPEPRPPAAARPRRLAVTEIRLWISDPYAIYAKRVLGLAPLEPLSRPADARELGAALHAALHGELAATGEALPPDFADRLAAAALAELQRRGLGPAELALEDARMRRAAAWFAQWERARRAAGWLPLLLESRGVLDIPAPAGPFTLTARADRIDRGRGGLAILDYKTGGAPGGNAVTTGLEPQLTLEAAILAAGGFAGAPAAMPAALLYLRLRGGAEAGEEQDVGRDAEEVQALAHAALDGLKRRIAAFDNPSQPYRSKPIPKWAARRDEYDRLARRKEWTSPLAGEEDA